MSSAGDLVLESLRSFDALGAEWDELAERAGSVYGTPDWAAAWWEVYGDGRPLLLHAVRRASGELLAVLPLYLARRGPVPLVRFVGHGPADQLAPVCAPEDRPAAAAATRRVLRERAGRRALLLAERLPADEGWGAALAGRPLRTDSTPVLDLAGHDWESWLASRSSNFRQQVRRRERKLAKERDLRFRLVTAPEELDGALETLFGLHEARWADASSAFDEDRRRVHRAFARRALGRGRLRLWFADVDGAPAAGWLGFRFGGAEWYYQAGRDPSLDELRVGFVLLCHTIREAFADGMREYRFGLGDEPYKDRFADRDPGLETVVVGAAPVAVAAGAGVALVRRLPPGLRARVAARVR